MTERKEGRNTPEEDETLKEYTWDEIRKHNQEEDLWVVLYSRVYNVTEFQIDHPGGPDVLQDIAAQDATEEFENILHTPKARKMAKKIFNWESQRFHAGQFISKKRFRRTRNIG
eukprot:230785_1